MLKKENFVSKIMEALSLSNFHFSEEKTNNGQDIQYHISSSENSFGVKVDFLQTSNGLFKLDISTTIGGVIEIEEKDVLDMSARFNEVIDSNIVDITNIIEEHTKQKLLADRERIIQTLKCFGITV